MPLHRGIKLSIISQVELKIHPEFPHPESSQFTYRSPTLKQNGFDNWTPPSVSSDSKADRLLGRQSVISVYIPSIAGARFWIRYNIDDVAAEYSPWYFFKLYMNGREITSWGTNSKDRPNGQVMRGLFEPSDRWNYKMDGVVYKNMGTEARPFYFSNDEEERSAGTDGGLIEVMVFRARGRKRRMPAPTDFKNQDGYGIVMPTAGLLDMPQDARFYDWHLKDPKNTPFATFKFHYRSWDSLETLQLIPADHPKILLSPTPSLLSINGLSREFHNEDFEQDGIDEEHAFDDFDSPAKSSESSTASSSPWMTTVFDVSPEKGSKSKDHPNDFVGSLEDTPSHSSRFSAAVIDKPTSLKAKKAFKEYLDRPLPEIPVRRSSLMRTQSRKSSVSSNAPSVAASLRSWADRGDTSSPETEIGVARAFRISDPRLYRPQDEGGFHWSPGRDRPNSKSPEEDLSIKDHHRYPSSENGERAFKLVAHIADLAENCQYDNVLSSHKKQLSSDRPNAPYRSPHAPMSQSSAGGVSKSNQQDHTPSTHPHRLRRSSDINIYQDATADTSSFEESVSISAIENLLDAPTKPVSHPPRTSSMRQGMTTPIPSTTFTLARDITNITTRKPSPKKSPKELPTMPTIDPILCHSPAAARKSVDKSPTKDDEHQPSLDDQTTLSLTESEWMCRTPSPVKSKFGHDLIESLRNVGPDDRYKENDEIDQLHEQATEEHSMINPRLRKRAMTWYEKVRGASDVQEAGGRPMRTDSDDEGTSGENWI